MEDDLVKKFFESDLTEAEEKNLSERLLTSTEDALRFGQEAEARYARTGLPEPQWPGAVPVVSAAGTSTLLWIHGGLRILAGLLGLAIAAVVVFSLWRAFAPSSVETQSQVPAAGAGQEPSVIVDSQIHRVPAASNAQASLVPVLTPVDMDHPSGRAFSSLSITVHKVSQGPVTVEVLTLEGAPLLPLYHGILKPGNWGFEWDGRLSSGAAAPSGYYQIELNSGSDKAAQKKVIQIQ